MTFKMYGYRLKNIYLYFSFAVKLQALSMSFLQQNKLGVVIVVGFI